MQLMTGTLIDNRYVDLTVSLPDHPEPLIIRGEINPAPLAPTIDEAFWPHTRQPALEIAARHAEGIRALMRAVAQDVANPA